MRTDTETAKDILLADGITCVFCRGGETVKCSERGVKPLLELIESKKTLAGYCAADKVVGSAAAFLYTILKPDEVYARVIGDRAVGILQNAGIKTYFDSRVPVIINRQNTGVCPMEQAVKACDTAVQALTAIKQKLQTLNS